MNHASILAKTAPLTDATVRKFREILVWPVQLMPLREGAQIHTHWERLEGSACPWQEITDEFTTDCRDFKERHYVEFVAFMPHVQRFLYGEGATTAPGAAQRGYGVSPIRVFRGTTWPASA
jgi:hypothetical protein